MSAKGKSNSVVSRMYKVVVVGVDKTTFITGWLYVLMYLMCSKILLHLLTNWANEITSK